MEKLFKKIFFYLIVSDKLPFSFTKLILSFPCLLGCQTNKNIVLVHKWQKKFCYNPLFGSIKVYSALHIKAAACFGIYK